MLHERLVFGSFSWRDKDGDKAVSLEFGAS